MAWEKRMPELLLFSLPWMDEWIFLMTLMIEMNVFITME